MQSKIGKIVKSIIQNVLLNSFLCPMVVRRRFLKLYGHEITRVLPGYFMGYGKGKLIMQENSYCNYQCFFDLSGNIFIGKNCSIGMGVSFINSSHKIGDSTGRAGDGVADAIVIEDGVWIGANVTILQGVTIGSGCIIGAGSLVNKDCQSNGMYTGVPSKRIRNLDF